MRRVAVIYNPVSGGARGEAVSVAVEEALTRSGDRVTRTATLPDRGARDVAAALPTDVDTVVTVGGDGTLKEAVEGLEGRLESIVFGVIPMGNANIVARDLSIPARTKDAIDVLVSGAPTSMDLGSVAIGDRREAFLAVVGIGWDAETVEQVDRWRQNTFGRPLYRLWADGLYGAGGLRAATLDGEAPVTVSLDGQRMPSKEYHGVYIGNTRTFGKRMSVAPRADRASGALHVQARRVPGVVAITRQLYAALREREASAQISDHATGTSVEVVGERPFAVEVDGEARGRVARVRATVTGGALRILAPGARP